MTEMLTGNVMLSGTVFIRVSEIVQSIILSFCVSVRNMLDIPSFITSFIYIRCHIIMVCSLILNGWLIKYHCVQKAFKFCWKENVWNFELYSSKLSRSLSSHIDMQNTIRLIIFSQRTITDVRSEEVHPSPRIASSTSDTDWSCCVQWIPSVVALWNYSCFSLNRQRLNNH